MIRGNSRSSTGRGEIPLCVDSSNVQLNRYLGIQLQLTDHTQVNNKKQYPFVKRSNKYGVYVRDFYARGSRRVGVGRNIRVEKGICSTWRMRVSDDESSDNRRSVKGSPRPGG